MEIGDVIKSVKFLHSAWKVLFCLSLHNLIFYASKYSLRFAIGKFKFWRMRQIGDYASHEAIRMSGAWKDTIRMPSGCHQNVWMQPGWCQDDARVLPSLEWSPKKYSLWLNDCFKWWIMLYQSVNSAHFFTYF